MTGFLKGFLSGEKSPEEQALLEAQGAQRKRDVLVPEGPAMKEKEDNGDGGCCGGCKCRR